MKQTLQLRLGQQLTMTPQLQQAIKLLQLSTLDLHQEIQQALDSNMMLEVIEDEAPFIDTTESVRTESSNNDYRSCLTLTQPPRFPANCRSTPPGMRFMRDCRAIAACPLATLIATSIHTSGRGERVSRIT